MGYEIDKIESITLYHKETGEKICSLDGVKETVLEEPTLEGTNEKLIIKERPCSEFTMTFELPPKPNIMFIISPGRKDGKYATKCAFYRPKEYNWFQRLMYKICFGITIKQGNEVRREFL